jgi:hypothetical protein
VSARDDYPWLTGDPFRQNAIKQHGRMCDEIDRLRSVAEECGSCQSTSPVRAGALAGVRCKDKGLHTTHSAHTILDGPIYWSDE